MNAIIASLALVFAMTTVSFADDHTAANPCGDHKEHKASKKHSKKMMKKEKNACGEVKKETTSEVKTEEKTEEHKAH